MTNDAMEMIACASCGAVCRKRSKTCQRCGASLEGPAAGGGREHVPDTLVDVRAARAPASRAGAGPAPDPSGGAPIRLVLTLGRALVQVYHYASPIVTVGRAPENDIVIDDESISREHCRVRREQSRFAVHDLGTANGTTVNGRAAVLQQLVPGDEIGIGRFVLLFQPSDEQVARYDFSVTPETDARSDVATAYLDSETIDNVRRESAAERGAHLRLVGSRSGRRFELRGDSMVLGHSLDADVPLLASLTAERHCVIERRAGKYVITHVAGLRSVYLNGRKVKEAELSHRDQIRIGSHTFQFFDAV